jgi:5,10-methylenetetrahydromethanopterin reductase
LATAGACGAATRHVRIAMGVVNPFTRHPVQIAMDFAALDELTEGRAILGIGSGIAGPIARLGVANDRPVTAMREAIAILRALLAGDSVTLQGRVFSVDSARLAFTPSRSLPIYMAAASDAALRLCGEVADGFIVSNMTPLRSTRRMAAVVAEAAARARRPMPRIVQYAPCAVRADAAIARYEAKAPIAGSLTSLWPMGDDWPQRRETAVDESGIPRADFADALARLRRGEDAATALDERFVEAFAVAGTVEECLDQAAGYRAAGVDELALTFGGARPLHDIADLGARVRG